MTDRESHRAAVEAGYASLAEYIKKWGDDKMNVEPILEEVKKWKGTAAVALFNVEKLKDEIERLREALKKIADSQVEINAAGAWSYCVFVAQAALQQKESE